MNSLTLENPDCYQQSHNKLPTEQHFLEKHSRISARKKFMRFYRVIKKSLCTWQSSGAQRLFDRPVQESSTRW